MSGEPPQGDALIVSGGGTTMVATDQILADAAIMQAVSAEAGEWHEQLLRIRLAEPTPAPTWHGDSAGLEVMQLARLIDVIGEQSRVLSAALQRAAEEYGEAERRVEFLARISAAGLASALGYLAPFLALLAVPSLTAGAVAWFLASLATGSGFGFGETSGRLARWIDENPRMLTNPVVVAAVRALVSAGDDAAAGAFRIPPGLSLALGDDAAGIFGVTTTAAGLVAVARTTGALRETAVGARRVGTGPRSPPPAGVADLARRIPSSARAGPQIRIERYGDASRRAWVVYVGGTADWSLVPGGDPWDMTSNAAAIAEQSAGSYRAVVEAMHEAGVQPADPVIGVGHSQGGLIMAQVAGSDEFNTVGLATFGAPAGQVVIPDAVPVIATEHADDLVPALGGARQDNTGDAGRHVVVTREAFSDTEPPAGEALPAHNMSAYRETARLIDASPEPRLREFRAELEATLGAEPGQTTLWRASRLPAG